ncbi:class I SAM-dependent methyltransferase [Candidatus Saganbacteria bacterium]|nr:class I SAM-dependent methyltransferase [Candidatus Saganbacteria bacterium]
MNDKNDDPDGYYRIKYMDKIKNLESLMPAGAEKSILDLGAGFGDYLQFMKENGWTVQGVEPSEYCLKTSRHKDCNVILGGLEDLDQMDLKRCSVITLNTVLEHYTHPEALLLFIKEKLMGPDTVLHIEVPNDFSSLQSIYNTLINPKQYWVGPLSHLNYWTHETLIKMVKKLGFKVEIVESTFPLELMALLGDDYVTYPEKGRGMHLKRVALEKRFYETGNIELKLKLFRAFAQIGLGREILLYLKKGVKWAT